MGTTKTGTYSKQVITLADITKALGHPARIAILQYLVKKPGCMCGDIVNELPLSQATVSQHLKALKAIGLIQGEIEGVSVCYCIHIPTWNQYKKALEQFFQQTPAENGPCAC